MNGRGGEDAGEPTAGPPPLEWKFSQVFGERTAGEEVQEDRLRVATGSYSNIFRVFGVVSGSSEVTTLEASKTPMRRNIQNPSRPARSLSSLKHVIRRENESPGIDANGNLYDLTTKLLHLAWHPTENSIACAAANSLYMYYA